MADEQPIADEVAAHTSRPALPVSATGAAVADGSCSLHIQAISAEDSQTTGPGPAAGRSHETVGVPSGDPMPSAQQFDAAAAEGMLLEEDGEEEGRQAITFEELPPIVLAVAASRDG